MSAYDLNHVSGEECRDFTDMAFGIVSTAQSGWGQETLRLLDGTEYNTVVTNGISFQRSRALDTVGRNFYGSIRTYTHRQMIKVKNDKKIVGVILDDSALDNSLKVALLSDDFTISHAQNSNVDFADFTLSVESYGDFQYTQDNPNPNFPPLLTFTTSPNMGESYARVLETYNGTVNRPNAVLIDYEPYFQRNINLNLNLGAFYLTGIYRGYDITTNADNRIFSAFTLTKDLNNTLVIGAPYGGTNRYTTFNAFDMGDPREYCAGNLYELSTSIYSGMRALGSSMPIWFSPETNQMRDLMVFDTRLESCNLTAFNVLPCNIVLTKSYSDAINYLENDVMPADAILFPFDWENIPKTDGSLPGDGDSDGGDSPNEDGEQNDDLDDTPEIVPYTTAQQLTNNNLYWLQGGQLYSFINWFWSDAGEIAELSDLWNKIKGLYNDLASAVLNIRYMPIDISWIGGASAVNSIIVGMLEHTANVDKINRSNPIVRDIGSISIAEIFDSFCDYSPYANISLYLPYHGFIDLDVNLLMDNKLVVRALYDIIAGTIQYYIHCERGGKTFLINTVECKMAVDIPITLQSKSDRDSAIFNNVTNAVGNVLGATAATAEGNPIGLIMSTAGIAGSGTQSAPMSVKGNVGDTGANYASPYCAIYIKRPKYNRPKLYASRVGYPCNKNYAISALRGFFTVYNPQIDFTGNYLPLKEEIDEIYELLERGVYK